MKRKISNKEIIDNFLDAYFELLNEDECEVMGILKEKFPDLEGFDSNTQLIINKLSRNSVIEIEKTKKEKLNAYQKFKELVDSLNNLDDFIKENFSSEELNELKMVHRNFNGTVDDTVKKEFIILKLINKSTNLN